MKNDAIVAVNMNYGVASFSSRLSPYAILKRVLQVIIGPCRLLYLFKGEHLEWVQTSWPALIFPKVDSYDIVG